MNVGLAEVIKQEQVIVGGDGKHSINDVQYFYLPNEEILVKNSHGEYKFKVKDVKFSTSIAGALIVCYVLYESDDFSKIQIGDMVYKVIK